MKKVITMSLSQSSVRKAIKEVQRYKDEFNRKLEEFVRRLAQEGVVVAKMQIMAMPAVDTGELLGSIDLKVGDVLTNGYEYIVYTGCEYAKYVEFGTGIVGENNPHPNPDGWQYDINRHGDNGWFYIGRDGEWHWTKGMPARPFMYNTVIDLYSKIYKIANEVFI